MDYRDRIISDIAKADCTQICRKVILALQKMTEGMQSGDDSPLKNIWDEVCAQVQFQKSIFWDLYLDTIRAIIVFEVERLDARRKPAIWLQTREGMDWEIDNDDDQQAPRYCDDDITEHILCDVVLTRAANWSNKRIEKYLESSYEIG